MRVTWVAAAIALIAGCGGGTPGAAPARDTPEPSVTVKPDRSLVVGPPVMVDPRASTTTSTPHCFGAGETIRGPSGGPTTICLHSGEYVRVELSAGGTWSDAASDATAIAAVTNVNRPAPQQITFTVEARQPGHAVITDQSSVPRGVGAPSFLWRAEVSVDS